jgi:hypothetical protein
MNIDELIVYLEKSRHHWILRVERYKEISSDLSEYFKGRIDEIENTLRVLNVDFEEKELGE